jgi:hypothetical protein
MVGVKGRSKPLVPDTEDLWPIQRSKRVNNRVKDKDRQAYSEAAKERKERLDDEVRLRFCH